MDFKLMRETAERMRDARKPGETASDGEHALWVLVIEEEYRVADEVYQRWEPWLLANSFGTVKEAASIRWEYRDSGEDEDVIAFEAYGQSFELTLPEDFMRPPRTYEQLAERTSVPMADWPEVRALFHRAREHFRSTFRPILEGVVPDVEQALDAKGL